MPPRPRPARSSAGRRAELVDLRVLGSVGFTDHAIVRFAQRAGLEEVSRASVEPIMRDLLLQEGVLTRRPPGWARSGNTAEHYLELGGWMVFVLRPDPRRPGGHTAVTAINREAAGDWAGAVRRGYITTPPPPRLEPLPRRGVSLRRCIRDVLAQREAGASPGGLARRIRATYRDRRRVARADRARVARENELTRLEYEAGRARGRERRLTEWEAGRTSRGG